MAKTKISEYSSTANSNTDIASINIDEGCAPSGINNAIRALMAQIHDLYAGSSGDTWPVTAGGTGSGTASGARTNLGLVIGTDVQAYDADLAAIASSGKGAEIASYGTYGVGFKNRIINGAMMIDQRNAGASVTPSTDGQYTLDRWYAQITPTSKFSVQQNSGSVTPPTGFSSYLGVTSLSAYSVGSSEFQTIAQTIEGLNFYDMAWGTANAAPISISFWVRSSLTGTFGGTVANAGQTRSYPFTYTISSANTWEQKTVTIAGDTTGTWPTTNAGCLRLRFGLGVGSTLSGAANSWSGSLYLSATGATSVVGTSGATFYITGVQLEKGSTATAYDYRPYGTELALCQRYYSRMTVSDAFGMLGIGSVGSATSVTIYSKLPVSMRSQPTINYSNVRLDDQSVSPAVTSLGTNRSGIDNISQTFNASGGGLTVGRAGMIEANNSTSAYIDASAEL